MTTCCMMNANILYTLIQLDNSKHCSRAISRLSEGRKIPVLSCNIDYPDPESMFAFSVLHIVIAQYQNFQKIFPPKKHIFATAMTRGRDKRLTWP